MSNQPSREEKLRLVMENYGRLSKHPEVKDLLKSGGEEFFRQHDALLDVAYQAITDPASEYLLRAYHRAVEEMKQTGKPSWGDNTKIARDRVAASLEPLDNVVRDLMHKRLETNQWQIDDLAKAVSEKDALFSDALRERTSFSDALDATREYFSKDGIGSDEAFRYVRKPTHQEMYPELKKLGSKQVGKTEYDLFQTFLRDIEESGIESHTPQQFYHKLDSFLDESRKFRKDRKLEAEIKKTREKFEQKLVEIDYRPRKSKSERPAEDIKASPQKPAEDVNLEQLVSKSGLPISKSYAITEFTDPETGKKITIPNPVEICATYNPKTDKVRIYSAREVDAESKT